MVNLTAVDEVLLAASKLTQETNKEFTEWDLTVQTWLLNKSRWGLRGYEQLYPDHKRVMNEIMAKGTQKAIGRGWLERTRQNHYRLTSAGLAKALSMSASKVDPRLISFHEYDSIAPYITNRIFENYCQNPAEPKTWLGASAFLGLTSNDPDALDKRLSEINNSIEIAIRRLDQNKEDVLRRSDSSKPVSRGSLLKLKEFLSALESRFQSQFDAIRAKRKDSD